MARNLLLLGSSLAIGAAQINPQHSEHLTMYHLNPKSAGVIPANMDTGDARGDLYFYLGQFLLPIECADPQGMAKFDCQNPERFGETVVTKVEMEIDNNYTKYSACNLCNGTDPFSHKSCTVGTYVCDCFNFHSSGTCDPAKVGMENKTGRYLSSQPYQRCTSYSKDYECWDQNIRSKVGGIWYSTLAEGMCDSSSAEGTCSWKVMNTSTVKASCLKDSLADAAEAADKRSCFSQLGPRNYTSHEWISCLMDTVLGPEAKNSTKIAGMPLEDLVTAWEKPFLSEAAGGCPKLPSSSYSFVV